MITPVINEDPARTEDTAKSDLQKHLGSAVRDDIWHHLIDRDFVKDYLSFEGTVEGMATEYRYMASFSSGTRKSSGPPPELPPDNRSESLAEIIATKASKIPEVQAFRKRRLRGRLLPLEEWTTWLRRRLKKERPKRIDAEALQRCVQFSLEGMAADYPGKREVSRWLGPSRFIAEPGGAIEDLVNTARIVEDKFGPAIDLRRAVILVLTGQVWLPRIISEEHMNYDYPPLARIRLEIDPRVKPRELQEYYAKLRDRAFPARGRVKDRVMSDKHLQLAVFASTADPPWAEALKRWNAEHPDPKFIYSQTRSGQSNFSRDLKSAYERVTGRSWLSQEQALERREQALERRKESFKADYIWEGRSEDEAEKMAEIAVRGGA